jgi:IS30 family transposase
MASEDAAVEAGISQAVGTRWFREAGGIPPPRFGPSAKPLSGRYLSFTEREEIALLRVQGYSIQGIARRLGRAASTISRELRRNAATRSGGLEYRATTAQWHADRAARRPKEAKLVLNVALRTYVEERLAGVVVASSGALVPGPNVSWKGRRHGPRQDRRWANAWSPEQIARRLPVDFPDDGTMRISHEAIYQALFVQGRGALRRELTACLRTGRALRMPRARTRRRGKAFLSPEIMISQRPAEIADRAVPGHWEGDLILGLGSSAIGTLVERTTRFTLLLHLPRMTGHGHEARVKNGPALAGHGAEAVRAAITRSIIMLPEELRRSLTWDQGVEMAQHARLKIDAGVQVYFCDPHSPWQRGTNENTNGLLRQYFPKGTDLSMHSAEEIAAVAAALNSRPRKTLDWRTPAETLHQLLLSANNDRVATIA